MSPAVQGPPQLPGYEQVRLLGKGGFAEVYLYQQQMPRRQVAVKVLLDSIVTESVRQGFDAEANVMAQLSTHPSIVAIYQADIAADGRPFLVMEYCPRPNLSVRYRTERIGVPEALRIGVRLAGAVETAHRAGILHRDIKPANVLTTEYGWPKLTDFGIAVAAGGSVQTEGAGMSVPWAAPELFDEGSPAAATADVYALAATIYTLLAGRSPFEVPGGPNGVLDLMARIEGQPLAPLSRPDTPASLNQVLATAMAKDPADRYPTAIALARALQQVEIELRLPTTAVDVLEATPAPQDRVPDDTDGRTRVRGVAVIAPQAPVVPPVPPTPAPGQVLPSPPRVDLAVPDVAADSTLHRSPAAAAPAGPPPQAAGPSRVGRYVAVAAAVVVVLAVVTAVLLGSGGGDTPAAAPTTGASDQPAVPPQAVAPPTHVVGTFTGPHTAVFRWQPPKQKGVRSVWRRVVLGEQTDLTPTTTPRVSVDQVRGNRVCIEVSTLSLTGATSSGVTGCASR